MFMGDRCVGLSMYRRYWAVSVGVSNVCVGLWTDYKRGVEMFGRWACLSMCIGGVGADERSGGACLSGWEGWVEGVCAG